MTTTILIKDIPPFVEKIHVSGGEVSFQYQEPIHSFGGNVVLYQTLEEIRSVLNPIGLCSKGEEEVYPNIPNWVPFRILDTKGNFGLVQVASGQRGWIVLDKTYLKKLSF